MPHGGPDRLGPTERRLMQVLDTLAGIQLDLDRERVRRYEIEALFDRVFQAMTDAVVLVDPRGRVTRANDAALELLGCASEDVLDHPVSEFLLPDTPGTPWELFRRAAGRQTVETTIVRGDARRVTVSLSCGLVRDTHGKVVGAIYVARNLSETQRLLLEIERAEARWRLLAEVGDQLSRAVNRPEALEPVLARVAEEIGCRAGVVLTGGPDHRMRLLPDSGMWSAIGVERQLLAGGLIVAALAQRSTLRSPPASRPEERAPGEAPFVAVPMVAKQDAFGALVLVFDGDVPGSDAAVELGEEVGRRLALWLANAALHESERAARTVAESAGERMAFLAEAGAAVASSLEPDQIAGNLARAAVPRIADLALVVVGVDARSTVSWEHADPGTREELDRRPPDPGEVLDLLDSRSALRRGDPRVWPALDADELSATISDAGPRLSELDVASALVIPVVHQSRPLGLVVLGRGARRSFGDEDLTLGRELGARFALALDNSRLYAEQRHIAYTLQHSLLPATIPDHPVLETAAMYRSAGEGREIGGDFYDVFDLDDGSRVVVMGDVCGKGVEAAALTASARHTLRAATVQLDQPAQMLRFVNSALVHQGFGGRYCTIVVARLASAGSELHVSVASGGHPLPIVLGDDGSVGAVGRHGLLLGVLDEVELAEETFLLGGDECLVLYTDGVTDARVDRGWFGEDGLHHLLTSCRGLSAEKVVDRIMRRLEDPDVVIRDDVAAIAVRRR